MTAFIVVDHPEQWPLHFPAAEVISADAYLREDRFSGIRQARVYNLCDSYGYQTAGYYVSLLAAARGHRTMPSVATIQDMKSRSLLRADDELEELIQRSLHKIVSNRFELSIYFGCNLAERHAALSRALFNLFPVPLMRASFAKSSTTGKWRPSSIAPIPVGDLPESHGWFLRRVIEDHFARRGPAGRSGRTAQYEHDLAILTNDDERSPPSNREALKRFERAARANGFDVEFLNRDDYGRIAEFDAPGAAVAPDEVQRHTGVRGPRERVAVLARLLLGQRGVAQPHSGHTRVVDALDYYNQAARLAAILPDPDKWSAAAPGPYVSSRATVLVGQAAVVVRDGLDACVK